MRYELDLGHGMFLIFDDVTATELIVLIENIETGEVKAIGRVKREELERLGRSL